MPAGAKGGSKGPSEETKRKFREALERKHGHGGSDVAEPEEHGKVDHAQGPPKPQQMFRRKSGS